MKKLVLKVELHDEKCKKKAMKIVSGISGVDWVSINMKKNKMTVIGETNVMEVVNKLRKICPTEIIYVAKEPAPVKKKEEAKKPDDNEDEEVPCIYSIMPCSDSQLENFKGFNPQTSTQSDTTTLDDDVSKSCVIC